ncbi:MAG: hypothetical protein SFW07_06320 [Gammaproteobacteria bacterium]|nr:hypothetical protein [Gammaproteobacteria bacterium]
MSAEKPDFQKMLELDKQAAKSTNFWDRIATCSSPALIVDPIALRKEKTEATEQTSPRAIK